MEVQNKQVSSHFAANEGGFMYIYCIVIDDLVAALDIGSGKAQYQPMWRASIGRQGQLYDEIRYAWHYEQRVETEKLITCATWEQATRELEVLKHDPHPHSGRSRLLKSIDADGGVDVKLYGKRGEGENQLARHALYTQASNGLYLQRKVGNPHVQTHQPDE